jgi:hypothetical protein
MKARLIRWAVYAAVAVALALVFISYLRPGFLLDLGNRIALCF